MAKKVLIITLFSGENEFCDCISSIMKQSYKNFDHTIIANYPNIEAHRSLYSLIMERADRYDLFIKIDADMVLKNNNVIGDVVEYIELNGNIDHAIFSLMDWMTGEIILGMHAFSPNAKWEKTSESLFVDPFPMIPGERAIVKAEPSPVADHSPNPSVMQAFFFGYHRALKVVQRDRVEKKLSQINSQLIVLSSIWSKLKANKDKRFAASIYGAECAFRDGGKHFLRKSAEQMPDLSFLDTHDLDSFTSKYSFWWDKNRFGYKIRALQFILIPDLVNRVFKFKKRLLRVIKGLAC